MIAELDGKLRVIRRKDFARLTICRPQKLAISPGDRLQIKANVVTANGKKLANGEIVSVAKIKPNGTIVLAGGRCISPTFRQFTRGYAVTSYGSQGKTVEHVLFSDSATRASLTKRPLVAQMRGQPRSCGGRWCGWRCSLALPRR